MFRLLLLLVIISSSQDAAAGKGRSFMRQSLQSGQVDDLRSKSRWWQKLLVATAAVGVISSSTLPAQVTVPAEKWHKVKTNKRTPFHRLSSFYLHIQLPDGAWRVMHIEYVGMDIDTGEPLFIGPRAYITEDVVGGEREVIFDQVELSLVGVEGLIEQWVKVKEIIFFSHPQGDLYDISVITIDAIDFQDYIPIDVGSFPELNTPVEMVSYRPELANNLLAVFAYPEMWRDCFAGPNLVDIQMGAHSCTIPASPAAIGSPIFTKQDGTLVALYSGVTDDGISYGSTLSPDLIEFWTSALAVSPTEKVATTWGEIKSMIVHRE